MTTQQLINRHNLELADRFINDEVATIALYTDPNDEVFQTNLS